MPRSEPVPVPAVFGRYGRYYDLLYQDKPYEAECDAIEAAFRRDATAGVRSVLDVGCGTGGHAIPLARRGYHVEGTDASPVMLQSAAAKAERGGVHARFHIGDMRSSRMDRQFDAVLCLFASLGYLTETREVLDALTNFRAHLASGGLLVLDVWNGIAVAKVGPSMRVKRVTDGDIQLVRSVRPEVDFVRQICRNFYHLLVLEGSRVVEEIEEMHDMRFFFPQELAHYLADCGFEMVRLGSFPDLGRAVQPSEWNLGVVARAQP